ncbi:MAG TPA: hypothetical protein VGZ47_07835, partial [Gemmataceae bacterium]|nr:hypothetical protein [Gemmataceae bacterium]
TVFTSEDLAKNLGLVDEAKKITLTDDQKEKLKEIGEQARSEIGEMFKGGNFDMKKMQAIQKETKEKQVNVLTSEQKKTWTEMTGKPLEIQFDFGGFGKKKNP